MPRNNPCSRKWLATLGATLPAAAAAQSRTRVDLPADLYNAINRSGITPGAPDNPEVVVGILIRGLLSILGVLFFLLIIYGGFLWMTAQGAEEQISKAKRIIISASVGLAVVLAAYLVSFTIIQLLVGTTVT